MAKGDASDRALVQAVERALRRSSISLDRFFFDAFGGSLPQDGTWDEARAAIEGYARRKDRAHPYWQAEPCAMLIDEVEAIWAAIDQADDWRPFHGKIAAIRQMGDALA